MFIFEFFHDFMCKWMGDPEERRQFWDSHMRIKEEERVKKLAQLREPVKAWGYWRNPSKIAQFQVRQGDTFKPMKNYDEEFVKKHY